MARCFQDRVVTAEKLLPQVVNPDERRQVCQRGTEVEREGIHLLLLSLLDLPPNQNQPKRAFATDDMTYISLVLDARAAGGGLSNEALQISSSIPLPENLPS